MKKKISLLAFAFYASISFGQGWIGNGPNLIAYNEFFQLTPLNIGIGTNNPTAQLHTTSSVRFTGLVNDNTQQRVIVQDANGLLSWRDASTISGPQNAWLLNGNAGTSPNTNFLGTTDNQRLVFRTNNTEKLTILPNGNVGLGVSNPTVRLHATNRAGSMLYPYETGVFENPTDTKLGVYNSNPGTLGSGSGGAAIAFGYSNVTNAGGNFPGYEIQYGATSNSNFFLRFNSLNRNPAGAVVSSNSNEMVISNGNIGINLGPASGIPNAATARLHTNGAVRFQNLPVGSGFMLVIDAAGNIFRTNTLARNSPSDAASTDEMFNKIADMEKEVKNLRVLVENLINAKTNLANNRLFSIYPNPAKDVLKISLNPYEDNFRSYKIIIRDVLGNAIIETSGLKKSIEMPIKNLSNGTYLVSIYDNNGQLLQTEKTIIQK